MFGYNVGMITFECLRHYSVHKAPLEYQDGKLETECPRCNRRYIMRKKGKFYSDRPLKVIKIDFDHERFIELLLIQNTAYEYRKERGRLTKEELEAEKQEVQKMGELIHNKKWSRIRIVDANELKVEKPPLDPLTILFDPLDEMMPLISLDTNLNAAIKNIKKLWR